MLSLSEVYYILANTADTSSYPSEKCWKVIFERLSSYKRKSPINQKPIQDKLFFRPLKIQGSLSSNQHCITNIWNIPVSAQSKQTSITVILFIINPLTSYFYLRYIQPSAKIMRSSKFISNILNLQKKPIQTQHFSSLKV